MTPLTRDETTHGRLYYLASEADAEIDRLGGFGVDQLENIAAYIGVGGLSGANPQQLEARIKAEFDRLSEKARATTN
jgi:hypothetical protein